jgi:HEAT repeat protein
MTLIDRLLAQLDHPNISSHTNVRDELINLGSAAVEPLIELLESGTERQVARAVLLLGEIADPRAIEPVLKLLNHPSLQIRINVAQAIGNFTDKRVVDTLVSHLFDDDCNVLVQTWILVSLGKNGHVSALEPLIRFLHTTSSDELRYMAIRALGDLGDVSAINDIVPYLGDASSHVQRDAHAALTKLGYQFPKPNEREEV